MKLQYLAQIQTLLEQYDFQEKYSELLKLEEEITRLEVNERIDRNTLFANFGSPAEYTDGIIAKYKLAKSSQFIDTSLTDTSELLQFTKTGLQDPTFEGDYLGDDNFEAQYQTNKSGNSKGDTFNHSTSPKDKSNSIKQHSDASIEREQASTSKKKSSSFGKRLFHLFYLIIYILFCLIAFLILVIGIITSIGVLFLVDIQTALSLFIGLLFMIISIFLTFSFIKNLVYGLFDRKLRIFKLLFTLLFIGIFTTISKQLISSATSTIGLYVSDNIAYVQNIFYQLNIDISNIDWQNFDFKQGVDLVKQVITGIL